MRQFLVRPIKTSIVAMLSVILVPNRAKGHPMAMGVALILARALTWVAPDVLTMPEATYKVLSGEDAQEMWLATLLGWMAGTWLGIGYGGPASWQGATVWGVVVSGATHGLLLSVAPDVHRLFPTMTQGFWLSGLLAPVISGYQPLFFVSPLLLALSSVAGMVLGWYIKRRQQRPLYSPPPPDHLDAVLEAGLALRAATFIMTTSKSSVGLLLPGLLHPWRAKLAATKASSKAR